MVQDLKSIAQSLSALERKMLPYLKDSMTLQELVLASGLLDVEVRRGLMWLENRGIIAKEVQSNKVITLGKNGELAVKFGLPEYRILTAILNTPVLLTNIVSETLSQGEIMSSIGILKSLHLADVIKTEQGLEFSILPAGKALVEHDLYEPQKCLSLHQSYPLPLSTLSNDEKSIFQNFCKRKDFMKIELLKTTTITLQDLGRELIAAKFDFSDMEEQLTSGMLKNSSWKGKTFRTYDVTSAVPAIAGGRRHPNREAANIIRDVYLSMGFQEMSGPWVETAFWCMDSMWIPQDHPARDEQDTFFVGSLGDLPDAALVNRVKEVHETGADTGSIGHGTPWNPQIARQLILRTHSTATTFRMFGEHGIKDDGKYFYVANVFRNEAVDATHLAEFLQAEGFVIGDNLTLTDLMGFIKEFYARLGIRKIRFKPTYNPYTEPSLEAHYYDEQKDKWYALINSGIFRPESLYPYGIKKTVIAWGMGASRVASLLNKKNNLRELVGPTVDFEWIAQHKTPQPD